MIVESFIRWGRCLLLGKWASVTRKKQPIIYKSCPKMISVEKLIILTPLQKLSNNVSNLGKIIVATSFECLPKKQKKSPNLVTLKWTLSVSLECPWAWSPLPEWQHFRWKTFCAKSRRIKKNSKLFSCDALREQYDQCDQKKIAKCL